MIAADHDATLNPQTADESYVNDLNGNRRGPGVKNRKVDTDNRVTRDGAYEYTFDKEGNRTKRVTLDASDNATGATTEYVYDHRNRLVTVTETSTPKTRFLYTAQELDADTGLLYYNARWYDPATGTFLTKDPLGFAAGDTNQTRYVGNSPTLYVDPSGNASWWPWSQEFMDRLWGNPGPETFVSGPNVGHTDMGPADEPETVEQTPRPGRKKFDPSFSWGDLWDLINPVNVVVNWVEGAGESFGKAYKWATGITPEGLTLDQKIREIQVQISMRYWNTGIGIDFFNASRRLGSAELEVTQDLAWLPLKVALARIAWMANVAAAEACAIVGRYQPPPLPLRPDNSYCTFRARNIGRSTSSG